MKITPGTLARTIVLALALINQVLTIAGINPIPIEDDQIVQVVSLVWTIAAALIAWWKNNSFTPAAIAADEVMKSIKSGDYEEGIEP